MATENNSKCTKLGRRLQNINCKLNAEIKKKTVIIYNKRMQQGIQKIGITEWRM